MPMKSLVTVGVLAVACALGSSTLWAGQAGSAAAEPRDSPAVIPPPPVAPATVSRGGDAVTVRAVRLTAPLILDGTLDEEVYSTVPAISDFIQQEPRSGEPATEKTEIWILFDDTNVYVAARCWDSQPERAIANEMRRDGVNVGQNESLAIIIDAFHDKRNGLLFNTNILAARRDVEVTDEVSGNADWNTVWDARTTRFAEGWTIEIVLPFKSLRYNDGPDQVWGINVRRTVRWKNELSFLSPVPAFLGQPGILAVSKAATLVGLEVPAAGRNLEIKPYAISGLRTDHLATPPFASRGDGNIGLDAKYGVTKSLTFDATYNTDFAQVEDDVQQANLTRFSLFFPERREFFLEGQGIFAFGGVLASTNAVATDSPILFFSRRIGLNNGRPVPIVGGARLTGKAGQYSIGLLDIQSGDEPEAAARPTNFAALRIKRELFSGSSVGVLYTRREDTSGGTGASETFGLDGLYSLSRSLYVNASASRTRTPGLREDDASYRARFDYDTDRYGLQMEHLTVGANFNPAIGFARRHDFQREFVLARFSPRPARTHMRAVRRFVSQGSLQYVESGAGTPDLRETEASLTVEWLNTDYLMFNHFRTYERIPRPFAIAPDVTVPVGGYDSHYTQASYRLGQQHRVAGTVYYQEGSLYGGTKRTLGLFAGQSGPPQFPRIQLSTAVSLEPSVSMNWVRLPYGDFTSTVVSNRTIYSLTSRMFVSALIQYNSSINTLSTNARLRWEYRPGSELFVVYSDGRDTGPRGFPELMNRAFVVKVTRLFRL